MQSAGECIRAVRLEQLECRMLLATHALAEVPALIAYHSYPQATAKLFLDFDGDFTRRWGGLSPKQTPAYSVDDDPSTFTDEEIANVREITRRVAEKFSPFNLDVTTEDPGDRRNKRTFCVVVGGDGGWFNRGRRSRGDGVAYVGSFTGATPNVAWVFSAPMVGDLKWVAEGIAHEAGHGFGLRHQRSQFGNRPLEEYYRGFGDRSPIMGGSNRSSGRGLWWRTVRGSPQYSPDAVRDELKALAGRRNGFGYRPDDHGASPDAAGTLDPLAGGGGVIETTGDEDWFAFTSAGGGRSFEVRPSPDGGMLDAAARIVDAGGRVVAEANTESLGETVTAGPLPAGTYYLVVGSALGYGDVGQYTVHNVT